VSLREAVRVAAQALVANRLRSALTMLGVLIGVMSVVLLVAIGQGAREEITGAIEGLGSNLLFVLPGDGDFGAGPSRSQFVLDDVERLERDLPGTGSRVAASTVSAEPIQAEGNRLNATVLAVTAGYPEVLNREVARGLGFTESDVATSRRTVVLGATTAADLFGTQDPIGRTVGIGGVQFRVTGVLARVGGGGGFSFGPDQDRTVLIPASTGQRLFGTDRIDSIFVRATSTATIEQDRAIVERVLSQRVSEDDFSVVSQDEIIGVVGDILSILTTVLGAIAGISLLVGGVGVSNIMLVSVSERTREIGLRKALGARTRDITLQFLFEAIALTVIGGAIVLALGIGGAELVAIFAPVPAAVTWWSVALALGVSTGVGLLFGVLPARRAGRLDPVEALRRD
jgi:putative ABC transport system permease protein